MRVNPLGRLTCALALAWASVGAAQNVGDVVREEIAVEHVSTVPSNRGEVVDLSVHRYIGAEASTTVVVVSPDPLPAVAAFGLDGATYDHLAYWASEGFDVFAADVTGYGLSPRPRMGEGCNARQETQTSLLTPYPLYIPCDGEYSRLLTSLETDTDELETIMQYVGEETGRPSATFVGWGFGAARAAAYAARYPERVDRLVLLSPVYVPDAPNEIPDPYSDGYPLRAHDLEAILGEWQETSTCDAFAAPEELAESLATESNRLDPLAAGWGLELGRIFRSPGLLGTHGWNREAVRQLDTPTLIVRGELDTNADMADALFDHLGADTKVRLDVECGTHWLIWEATRESIRDVIAEFAATGEIGGWTDGVVRMDREGNVD